MECDNTNHRYHSQSQTLQIDDLTKKQDPVHSKFQTSMQATRKSPLGVRGSLSKVWQAWLRPRLRLSSRNKANFPLSMPTPTDLTVQRMKKLFFPVHFQTSKSPLGAQLNTKVSPQPKDLLQSRKDSLTNAPNLLPSMSLMSKMAGLPECSWKQQ